MKKIVCILALLCAFAVQADAQNLKDILTGVVKNVVGDKTTTANSIVGTWKYVAPACQFKGENLLTNIGGDTAGSEVEKKIEPLYQKAGLNTIEYTFNEDKTCSYIVKGKKVEGTYEFDPEAKTITIKGGKLGVKVTAQVVTLGSNMSFLFDADKLLSVVKTITGVASKFSTQASALNKLTEKFNGLLVGFELQKQ